MLFTFRDDGVDYKYPVIPALKTTFIPKIKISVIPACFWAGIFLPVIVGVKLPLPKRRFKMSQTFEEIPARRPV